MKLLFCKACQDIIRLIEVDRACRCGKTRGHYLRNGLVAFYSGDHAVPLGITNSSFERAIRRHPIKGEDGESFEAFVISVNSETFLKIGGRH